MVYSFRKMFFIGQNLKHVHMTNSFLELLIFFCLEFYFSPHQRIYRPWIQTSWETNHEIPKWTCLWHWCWKNLFFDVKLKLMMNKFSQFHEHIFRSSRSHMFFKITALKSFAILRIKMRLQHRCFPVRSSHVMLIYW